MRWFIVGLIICIGGGSVSDGVVGSSAIAGGVIDGGASVVIVVVGGDVDCDVAIGVGGDVGVGVNGDVISDGDWLVVTRFISI